MEQASGPQHRDAAVFFRCRSSCDEGSGRLSLGTRCITAVFPVGNPRADRVTLPCRNRPWYIKRRISALETASSRHSSGQLSKTYCAISPALSLGEKRYSLVFPLTRISLRFILSAGTFEEPSTGMLTVSVSVLLLLLLLLLLVLPPSLAATPLSRVSSSGLVHPDTGAESRPDSSQASPHPHSCPPLILSQRCLRPEPESSSLL